MTVCAFANVNFIDISKATGDSKFVREFSYLKDNKQFFDHWTNKWEYEKSKVEFITKLREIYSTFSSIPTKNQELYLLLGDISHYLYNLEDNAFDSLAVKNYNLAIKENALDYRNHWFLGFHYALSNLPIKAIENLLAAEKLLPAKQPAEFWNDYAEATALVNMPSHCIYAMDKVISITGLSGAFETQIGEPIIKRLIDLNKSTSYKKEEIWAFDKKDKVSFTSRPLGAKIIVDSIWNVSIYDYENYRSAFIINPPELRNPKEKKIGYSILVMFQVVSDEEKLDDLLNKLVAKYADKKKIEFTDKYAKVIAYEIKDKSIYCNMGGGHIYTIGIEREMPLYPGLLFETPFEIPAGKNRELSYYKAANFNNRFKSKIFYTVILDTCEDIHEQSYSVFKNLFDNQIIFE